VRLAVNGTELVTWTASPRALEDLGVGRLWAMGYIRTPDDVLDLAVHGPTGAENVYRIEATIREDALAVGTEEQRHRSRHGCGLRYLIDCRPDLLPSRDRAAALPDPEAFPTLFRELYDHSPSRNTTGGHHTTALTDGSTLFHVHEVVGRHNGADKAIGGGLRVGRDLQQLGMVTTARISGAIAEKAARAGLAWLASRSVPTTLAVTIATAADLPMVARAAGKDARVFGASPPHTIPPDMGSAAR
jgi:FdhD protein